MEKKLPGVYANRIEKKLNNNEKVYYSTASTKNEKVVKNEKTIKPNDKHSVKVEKNIVQKINSIFNSPRYVYKADVDITLTSGVVSKKVIGKNSVHLITIENELIPISDIIDIEFSDKKNE